MNIIPYIILLAAAFLAGVVNAIAGGGSFLTFPALLLTGLDPRAANMTSTIALFPMQVTSGYAGRKIASGTSRLSLPAFFVISLAGGAVGATLLLLTPPSFFTRLVPWLILLATGLFAYSSFFKKPERERTSRPRGQLGQILIHFSISIYGGYFGGGIGLLMLATLTLAGMPIRTAVVTKNILAAVMNAAAVLVLIFSPDIGWLQAILAALASTLGGILGVKMVHFVNERIMRMVVVSIGLILTGVMFLR